MTLGLRDEWKDPLASAATLIEELIETLGRGWGEYLRFTADARHALAAQPLALRATSVGTGPSEELVRLETLRAALGDDGWAWSMASAVAEKETLGVVSFGATTRLVMEYLDPLGPPHAIFVDNAAVAQGLSYLRRTLVHRPPTDAAGILVPAVATHRGRMWTTTQISDAVIRAGLRGAAVFVATHPLAELSDEDRQEFRPASFLIDVKR